VSSFGRDRRHRRDRFKLFGGALSATLKKAVDQLGELMIGEDPLRIDALTHKLRTAAASAGPGGILTLAISAIDMALWDIRQILRPIAWRHARWAARARADLCERRSGARLCTRHLVKAAQRLVETGFSNETQLALPGDTSPEKEVERARLMRAAVGPEIDLMCDINQRWSTHQAMDIGKRVEDVHFFWLEDVTVHDDYSGLAGLPSPWRRRWRAAMFVWHYSVSPYIEAHSSILS